MDELIEQQIEYYRQRAPEYDHWWLRQGRYDHGPEARASWQHDIAEVLARLEAFAPRGDVLELAAGTGNWTQELLRYPVHLTALDASAETLAINRAKQRPDAPVTFVEAELFGWHPTQQFDVVFFSFWLSHVPEAQLAAFWNLVERCVAPGGRVFVLDSAHPDFAEHGIGDHERTRQPVTSVNDVEAATARRTLADGRAYDIVKRYWWPDELAADTNARGWNLTVEHTTRHFITAFGGRRAVDDASAVSARTAQRP